MKLDAGTLADYESTLDTLVEETGYDCPKAYEKFKDALKTMHEELEAQGVGGYWQTNFKKS